MDGGPVLTLIAAVVVVLPAADEGGDGIELRPEDIDVDVYRSSGAGGQHTCAGLAFALRRGWAEWISLSIRNGSCRRHRRLKRTPVGGSLCE